MSTPEDVERLYAVTRSAAENRAVADAAGALAKLALVRQYAVERDDRALIALLDAPRQRSAEELAWMKAMEEK